MWEKGIGRPSLEGLIVLLLCIFLMPTAIVSTIVDAIDTTHSIKDGETLVSASEIFELGFFSHAITGKRYLGIWYKKSVKTVVWVANKEVPLNDSSGVVKVTNRGILVLMDGKGITFWSSYCSRPVHNPVAQLLDSGNLVVKDERDKSLIWQSFDHSYDISVLTRVVVSHNGDLKHFKWTDQKQRWVHYRSTQEASCLSSGACGAYGVCNSNNSPDCACLDGFVPKNKTEWDEKPGSGGCIRKTPLSCSGDGFKEFPGIKFPDSATKNYGMSLEECETQCSKNCSCTAYASSDIGYTGDGCKLWFSELLGIRQSIGRGQVIYIRMSMSELGMKLTSTLKYPA